jgi:membrane protein implicated in regulation of membrane protease activity
LQQNVALDRHPRINMAESTIWWVLAGGLIAVELLSGTFYLLMLAIGVAAAGLAAQLGADTTVQMTVAALVGGGAVIAWRAIKQRKPGQAVAQASQDVNLDIGEVVHVEAWSADGTANVKYRGANWQVALAPGQTARPGGHTVVAVTGNRLIVQPV